MRSEVILRCCFGYFPVDFYITLVLKNLLNTVYCALPTEKYRHILVEKFAYNIELS